MDTKACNKEGGFCDLVTNPAKMSVRNQWQQNAMRFQFYSDWYWFTETSPFILYCLRHLAKNSSDISTHILMWILQALLPDVHPLNKHNMYRTDTFPFSTYLTEFFLLSPVLSTKHFTQEEGNCYLNTPPHGFLLVTGFT